MANTERNRWREVQEHLHWAVFSMMGYPKDTSAEDVLTAVTLAEILLEEFRKEEKDPNKIKHVEKKALYYFDAKKRFQHKERGLLPPYSLRD